MALQPIASRFAITNQNGIEFAATGPDIVARQDQINRTGLASIALLRGSESASTNEVLRTVAGSALSRAFDAISNLRTQANTPAAVNEATKSRNGIRFNSVGLALQANRSLLLEGGGNTPSQLFSLPAPTEEQVRVHGPG